MVSPAILLAIPLLPALGALVNGTRAFAKPLTPKNRMITNLFALGTTGLSAVLAAWTVISYVQSGTERAFQHAYYTWIPAGIGHVTGGFISDFAIDSAFRIDTLSCTMLLIVTWIGFLIHVYATGYMSHDTGYTRFFTYLNLFMFMMLLLILGANYLVMFVGWEGVGLCSYLLIGFYYDKNFAADAGKKAFITNRIGDFGFVLGLFLIFNTFGTSDYGRIFALISANPNAYTGIATAACLLLFVGACGKSAQIPLYVWLPDAMAGPTPVSALIHAATMVTACISLSGVPPLAGFFSKDEILAAAWEYHWAVWIVGVITAFLTAFYMFRLYFMTFSGDYRGAVVEGIETSEPEHGGHNLIPDQRHLDQGDEHTDKAHGHHVHSHDPHESPFVMTGVLMALAFLAVIGGFVGLPKLLMGAQ